MWELIFLPCSFPQCLSRRRKLSLTGYGKGCLCVCVSPFLNIRWVSRRIWSWSLEDQLASHGAGSSPLHLPFTQGVINAIQSSPPGVWTDDGGGILMQWEVWNCKYLHANWKLLRVHIYLPWAAGVGACMTHGWGGVGFWLLRMLGSNQISPSQSLLQWSKTTKNIQDSYPRPGS